MVVEETENEADMMNITDAYGRQFKTLRVSLTNVCNLACIYCVDPSVPVQKKRSADTDYPGQVPLSNNQYIEIIAVLNQMLGFNSIRLTGGEPTLYKQFIPMLNGLKQLDVSEIKMTSNAYLLSNKAHDFKKAGLTSVNISLDALDPDIFFAINKRKNLQQTLLGIEKSVEAGIKVKINCVVMKGVNDNQILKLLNYCKERNIAIRFLELMQMGHLHQNFDEVFFSEKEIVETISRHYNLISIPRGPGATAKYWMTDDLYEFGIISNESDPFCNDCNRLRLDSYGNIFGCLSDNTPIRILDHIHDLPLLKNKLEEALAQKKTKFSGSALSMLHIGG